MKIHKLIMAFILLDTAIQLFLRDKNYLSAITLAGAAEEILGVYAKNLNEETAYSILTTGLTDDFKGKFTKKEVGEKYINFHRNELKHFNFPEHEEIEIDPKFEAISMITRAAINLTSLKITTENIKEFNVWLQQNKPELLSYN